MGNFRGTIMIWFTSDWHIAHENIIEYDNRPFFDLNHMASILIANYNAVVKENDIVYFLGDFGSWSKDDNFKVFDRLNGKKIIIRGNHDYKTKHLYELGFEAVLEEAMILIGKRKIRLSHYPYKPSLFDRLFNSKLDKRAIAKRPVNDGKWLLHGHTHVGHPKVYKNQINVNVCHWDYKPVNVNQIMSIINKEIK
jgi:calcineurin-like phosphoesterase family protein